MNLREADILVDRLLSEAEAFEKNFEDKAGKIIDKARQSMLTADRACDALELQLMDKLRQIRIAVARQTEMTERLLGEERSKMLSSKKRIVSVATQLRAKHTHALSMHERELKLATKRAKASRESLEADSQLQRETTAVDPRASTLAIFDSIVFAMSNWSNEGDTAPDFELACQSVLFPTIYERVMKNEDDYYIEEVPTSALEVVKRGREYVKMLRDTAQASLVDPEVWESYAPMIQEWWVNDALPLLYGARSEEWDADTPFSLLEVQAWKSQPASRALRFPLLFDGMELVEKNRDQIRETTGLPEFNKQTLLTRLQP